MTKSSGRSRATTAAIVGTVVIIIIIIGGFVGTVSLTTIQGTNSTYTVPVISTISSFITQTFVVTSTSQYHTSSITEVPIQEQTQTNQAIFDIGTTLVVDGQCSPEVFASLPTGADAQIIWTTDNTVDAYVLTSSEVSSYGCGTTNSYFERDINVQSGNMSFHVSAGGTYYFLFYNPNTGLFGIGSKNDTVSSSGIATYGVSTTTHVAQTNAYIATTTVYSTITTTSTSTSTTTTQSVATTTQYSTSSCFIPFFRWLAGARC